MSVIALITELNQQDIRLWLEDGQLRFSAPKGGMDTATRELLKTNKNDIIHFLAKSQHNTIPVISKTDHTILQPLSFAQERFWFLTQLDPDNTAFNLSITISLQGRVDTAILERVLNSIIDRHSILRTAYVQTAEGTFQRIINHKNRPLRQQTCNQATPAEIQSMARKEINTPFDLEAGDVVHHLLLAMPNDYYLLLCTIHHIATDGWSMAVIGQEIAALYDAFSRQKSSPLKTQDIQYIDFAVWQRNLHRPALQRQLAYWQKQLANVPDLHLPTDFTRTANNFSEGSSFSFVINKKSGEQLAMLASEYKTTLFVVLLSVLSTLIYRYTQQNCFCIGTPISGRNQSSVESLVGCFLNMLALKSTHQPEHTFAHVLELHRQTTQDAFNNQDIPFEEVVKSVVHNRNLSVTPLFQVMFDLQNTPLPSNDIIGDIAIGYLDTGKSSALYDLSLHARETSDGINAVFEYKTGLFLESTIKRLARHFNILIESVISNPHQKISSLTFLSHAEKEQQIVKWNNTARNYDTHRYLHTYIERQAISTPAAIALRFNGASMSYLDMNSAANRFARHLQDLGIQPGSCVGVYMERSLQLPVILLAILKTGASYLPLDTGFPGERLNSITSHAMLEWIITDNTNSHWNIPDRMHRVVFANEGNWQALPGENINIGGHNVEKPLLNIIYTSGSTGEPKGVMVSHAAIINRLLWMQDTFPITHNDAVLQKTPYSFDVSVWELFWPLMNGATLVLAEPEGHKNPAYLHDIIIREKISIIHFVPSLLGVFLATQAKPLSTSLKRVFCSGETLPPSLANAFFHQYANTALINLYGPTEAAIDVSYHICQPSDLNIPLGKPISNIELYILDQQQQLLPAGATGEICIAGEGLAEGYLHQENAGNSAFINNPYCDKSPNHKTLYRTGDLARLDHDGNLYFLGRLDHQIKIRGLRIELGDIESRLNRHTDIRECLLTVREINQHQQLIAYYIARRPVETPVLRDYLAKQLPAFMVPNAFVELTTWPLRYNGKIDHGALPEPSRNSITSARFVAPRNAFEQTITDIWAELLNIDSIGIYDNFFEAGGHSLLATIAISRMQNAFGVKIPLAPVFQEPTIANCANIISLVMKTTPVLASVTSTPGDDEEEVTL